MFLYVQKEYFVRMFNKTLKKFLKVIWFKQQKDTTY
jgi:hypothetical protein